MEYIYAALLLHSSGKEVTEEAITSIVEAAGINVDGARVKALVSALDGVSIDEAISQAAFVPSAAAPTPAAPSVTEEEEEEEEEEVKEEEKKKEEEEAEESGMEGLGALFG
ncbi:MAG: 50S ribosomal protein P1 [Methanosarcinales archaeon]